MAESNQTSESQIQSQMEQSGFSKSYAGNYSGSQLQEQTYKNLQMQDVLYEEYIKQTYGSYENFLQKNKIMFNDVASVYDPTIDFIADVTVITKDESYKTDHISAQEVILESLSGVCTVIFMKVDGSVGRIVGTLDSRAIPTYQRDTRVNFFSPLAGDRVVIWDINKQGWRSFYMDRVIKFVRDDTIALE